MSEGGKITLEGNVFVEGSYFNLIAQSIKFSGGVSSYDGGLLENINFISGNNKLTLEDMRNPKILQKRVNTSESGIDGALVGSMNAGVVKIVATGEGLGVRHSGIILSPQDVVIESESEVKLNALKTQRSTKINAKNVSSIFLDGDNINIQAQEGVTNRGAMSAKNLKITTKDFLNKHDDEALSELAKLKITDKKALISSDGINISASSITNQGNLYAQTLLFDTGELNNQGEILSEMATINLKNNKLINKNGQIASKSDLRINAMGEGEFVLNDGGFYGGRLAVIDAKGGVSINGALLSPSSITIRAKSITNNNLLASGGSLSLWAKESITNKGYLYGGYNLSIEQAKLVDNQSGMHSGGRLQIDATSIKNQGIILAENIEMNAKNIYNLAKIRGDVGSSSSEDLLGVGGVNYGDTAWKRWVSTIRLGGIPIYENGLYLEASSIQATKNIAINIKSVGNALALHNEGWILAQGNISLGGVVENITKTQEIKVEDILKEIKTYGVSNKEFLGKWNTNSAGYLGKSGSSLLDILLFLDDKKNKDHQRESAWNALKKIASENKDLDRYLTLFLGGDYKQSRFIPSKDRWNLQAKILLTPKDGAKIRANETLNINASMLKQGILGDLQSSFGVISSKFDYSTLSKQDIQNSLGAMDYQGLFKKAYQYQGLVRREYVTSSPLIDQNNLYGADYFLTQWGGSKFASQYTVVGDNYYEKLYLLKNYGGLLGGLDDLSIKKLLDNGVKYGKKNGGSVGMQLSPEQIKDLKENMIWYVNIGDKEQVLLAPVVYFSPNVSTTPSFFAQIDAGAINLKATNLSSMFGKIHSRGDLKALIEGNLSSYSSSIQAQNAQIVAKDIIFASKESVQQNSSLDTLFHSTLKTSGSLSMQAYDNLTLQDTQIAGGKDSSITLVAQNLSLLNGYSNTYSYSYDSQKDKVLGISSRKQEALQSSILGGNIKLVAQNLSMQGSTIQAQKDASLFADNLIITSGTTTQRDQIFAFSSGVFAGMQHSVISKNDLLTQSSVSSKITAQGDVLLYGSKVAITGSELDAKNNLKILSDSLTIQQGENKQDLKEHNISIVTLNYNNTSTHTLTSNAHESKLSGSSVYLASKDISLQGALEARDLKIASDSLILKASENTISKESHGFNLGIFGGANVQLFGLGKGISYSEGEANVSTINSFNEGITLGGIRSEVFADAEVGVKFTIAQEKQNALTHTQSSIKADNLTITFSKLFDLGGSNLVAYGDLNIQVGEIKNTQYLDTSTLQGMKWSLYLREKIDGTSQAVALLNQQAEQIISASNGKDPNVGFSLLSSATGAINVFSNPLLGASSSQAIGIQTQLKNQSSTKELLGNINAGGSIQLSAKEGDINLGGVGMKANAITLYAKGNILSEAGYEKEQSSNTSILFSVEINQNAGLSIRDGGECNLWFWSCCNLITHSIPREQNSSSHMGSKGRVDNHCPRRYSNQRQYPQG